MVGTYLDNIREYSEDGDQPYVATHQVYPPPTKYLVMVIMGQGDTRTHPAEVVPGHTTRYHGYGVEI